MAMMTGDEWMADRLRRFKAMAAAGPALPPEKAAALLDLVGEELFSQVVTKDARPPTFDDMMGGLSDYIVSRGGRICL